MRVRKEKGLRTVGQAAAAAGPPARSFCQIPLDPALLPSLTPVCYSLGPSKRSLMPSVHSAYNLVGRDSHLHLSLLLWKMGLPTGPSL